MDPLQRILMFQPLLLQRKYLQLYRHLIQLISLQRIQCTPQANAAEEINAALGGTSPSLGADGSIDGGSAQDTINVAMDGNFLTRL